MRIVRSWSSLARNVCESHKSAARSLTPDAHVVSIIMSSSTSHADAHPASSLRTVSERAESCASRSACCSIGSAHHRVPVRGATPTDALACAWLMPDTKFAMKRFLRGGRTAFVDTSGHLDHGSGSGPCRRRHGRTRSVRHLSAFTAPTTRLPTRTLACRRPAHAVAPLTITQRQATPAASSTRYRCSAPWPRLAIVRAQYVSSLAPL